MRINKNIKLILNYFLGPLVFLLLLYTIRQQLAKQQHWEQTIKQLFITLQHAEAWKLISVILLMPLNWGIETKKWQLALHTVQQIPFLRAFKAICTGITFASFTPNRMGEYVGRMVYLEEERRVPSIALTIFCSISQLIVTIAAGIPGLLLLKPYLEKQTGGQVQIFQFWWPFFIAVLSFILLMLIFFYFRAGLLIRLAEKIPMPPPVQKFFSLPATVSSTILRKILFLSLFRYLVFLIQYFLLFSVFDVELSWWQAAGGMSVVFLIMAIIPTLTFLTELGLRWEAGIQVLSIFSSNIAGIFAASFCIWLINLAVPALVGSLFILGIKLFKRK